MKKVIYVMLSAIIMFSFWDLSFVSAYSIDEDKADELKEIEGNIYGEIKSNEEKVEDSALEIESLRSNKSKLEKDIKENKEKIEKVESEISNKEEEVKELKENIEQRKHIVGKRLQSRQSDGDKDFLDVLFGSLDFADFISRMSAIYTIIGADNDIVEEFSEDIIALEDKLSEIEILKGNLYEVKSKNEGEKERLKRNIEKSKRLEKALIKQIEKLNIDFDDIQDEQISLIREINQRIQKEQEEKEYLAKAKTERENKAIEEKGRELRFQERLEIEQEFEEQAELERQEQKRKESNKSKQVKIESDNEEKESKSSSKDTVNKTAESKSSSNSTSSNSTSSNLTPNNSTPNNSTPNNSTPSSPSSNNSTSNNSTPSNPSSNSTSSKDDLSDTKLEWPTVGGRISSGQGYRIHPVTGKRGSFHKGIDIARTDYSTVPPIFAAESGKVIQVSSGGGYGNMVRIKHNNGVETLYAHMSRIMVSTGQEVGRGETIGIMGTTGSSTGIHLHFEVHHNGQLKNPLRYLR